MHEDTFKGLTSSHIYERLPEAARADYVRITGDLEHGDEWRMLGGVMTLTAKGLATTADRLNELHYEAAALVIRRELKAALDAVKARSTPAAVPAGRAEDDVLASRWDLKGDNL